MTQSATEVFYERLAEELVLLYLRLNGYLTLGGYLLHQPLELGEGLRTEVDALAVRFPNQREPLHGVLNTEQPNDERLVLPRETGLIDFVVAEVKTGRRQPRFNDPLVKDDAEGQQNLRDLLEMLGCFSDQSEIGKAADRLLKQFQSEPTGAPATYDLKSGRARIRFVLFWEPRAGQDTQKFFIPLSHVLRVVESRTRPGVACGVYSRFYAKWRGVARYILEAIDEARSHDKLHENLKDLSDDVLRRLVQKQPAYGAY